jgi:hypothetical protein
MFSKTLVATLVVASVAFALVNKASAAPQQSKPSHEISWLDRASTNYDGGGY